MKTEIACDQEIAAFSILVSCLWEQISPPPTLPEKKTHIVEVEITAIISLDTK